MPRLSGQQANADVWNPRLGENQSGLSLDGTMVGRALSPLRQLLYLTELSIPTDMFSVCFIQHHSTSYVWLLGTQNAVRLNEEPHFKLY